MIPKIIHQIVGAKQTQLIRHCLKSWHQLKQSDFEIRVWNDNLIRDLLSKHYPFILLPFDNARNHAEAADIARYAIIHYYGGHYVDWDVELLNVSEFLTLCNNNPKGYLIQDPKNLTIAAEAFSGLAGELYLYSLLKDIASLYENGQREMMKTPQYSGPYRMRDVYYVNDTLSCQNLVPIKKAFLYDYDEMSIMPTRQEDVAMVHYWVHSWM